MFRPGAPSSSKIGYLRDLAGNHRVASQLNRLVAPGFVGNSISSGNRIRLRYAAGMEHDAFGHDVTCERSMVSQNRRYCSQSIQGAAHAAAAAVENVRIDHCGRHILVTE